MRLRQIALVARDLELDPAEVRRRNLISSESFPLPRGFANVLAGEIIYDSGDYPACLRRALGILVARHESLRTTFAVRDGQPVQIVPGSRDNLKVTVAADLPLAAWYMQQRRQDAAQ